MRVSELFEDDNYRMSRERVRALVEKYGTEAVKRVTAKRDGNTDYWDICVDGKKLATSPSKADLDWDMAGFMHHLAIKEKLGPYSDPKYYLAYLLDYTIDHKLSKKLTKEYVIKRLLQIYKRDHKIDPNIIDTARKAGFGGPEIDAIEKSAKSQHR
jgi:hypothetical protein